MSHATLRLYHVAQALQKDIRAFLVARGKVFGGLIRVGQVIFQHVLKSHGGFHISLTLSLLVVVPVLLGLVGIPLLRSFIAAAEQDYQRLALLTKVDPIARPVIHAQLAHAFANWFAVAQIPSADATDTGQDAGDCVRVT